MLINYLVNKIISNLFCQQHFFALILKEAAVAMQDQHNFFALIIKEAAVAMQDQLNPCIIRFLMTALFTA